MSSFNTILCPLQLKINLPWYSETCLNRTPSKPKTCLNQTDFTVPSTKYLCNLNLCKPNTCLNRTNSSVPKGFGLDRFYCITDILLKVALNTKNQTINLENNPFSTFLLCMHDEHWQEALKIHKIKFSRCLYSQAMFQTVELVLSF